MKARDYCRFHFIQSIVGSIGGSHTPCVGVVQVDGLIPVDNEWKGQSGQAKGANESGIHPLRARFHLYTQQATNNGSYLAAAKKQQLAGSEDFMCGYQEYERTAFPP